ncbi:UTRA domain-containing protein [Actinomadura macrotermitis]|uniref:UTRA domain-containing protein n=1 Tax=Actinomadura macrotermitis TaxID=2585200 RepID=UPI002E273129
MNDIPRINRNAVERQKRIARETGRGAFDAELTQMGLTPRSEPFHVGPAPIPAPAAEILGVETDTEVFARRRHMFANDVPVQLASSYVPNDLAERADLTGDTGAGGLYSRLADIGHGPERFRERVTVRPANEDEVAFLRGELDQPVYEVIRTAFDGEGRPVEVNILIMPVHQWSLTYEWDAE